MPIAIDAKDWLHQEVKHVDLMWVMWIFRGSAVSWAHDVCRVWRRVSLYIVTTRNHVVIVYGSSTFEAKKGLTACLTKKVGVKCSCCSKECRTYANPDTDTGLAMYVPTRQ